MRHALALLLAAPAAAFDDGTAGFYADVLRPLDNSTMTKVLMSDFAQSTGAVCLDGTPGAFYIRKGTGDGATKWYVHHQGGGWCESLDDCLGRSNGDLGSSKKYPATQNQGGGYFSPLQSQNPLMWNWNSVFMRYCDGGSFSGDNETVTEYKGKQLTYRGKRVREAIVATLKRDHGLGQATDLVVSGCSAGGLATFLHTDQWCKAVPSSKCVGLPDSGFFLKYQSPKVPPSPGTPPPHASTPTLRNTIPGDYDAGLSWVYREMNATSAVNSDCEAWAQAHGLDGHNCMFAEYSGNFTESPLFPLQSEYDSWQTGHVLASGDDVQVLGDNITARTKSDILSNKDSGVFLNSCHTHCGVWGGPAIDGDKPGSALQKWYNSLGQPGAKKTWIQGLPWSKHC